LGIRLPRIILGLSIGGALSLAGTLLQGVFKNPLVEPYTLGISGGASLGVCINILFKFYTNGDVDIQEGDRLRDEDNDTYYTVTSGGVNRRTFGSIDFLEIELERN